ncbi:CRISPR-associated endonuclease Cas2 [Bacteroides sp. OttesenSCG-928-E20]|nr:CRISPR-associated endonuclease Cas2 [Bacteroides sp. OttesenSCG-928-N06]MDL2299153.1 CRISPR-associated endonuclease Cas2 [Bacteroides sp. OttesenSCG-928-E20]MDL2304640.1 CRISPR-associated endonuclease Cas2 [Bacteroides sp. OttesenSCG-928-D19]
MGKKKEAYGYIEILKKLIHAGISESPPPNRTAVRLDEFLSTEERVRQILGVINRKNRNPSTMLFFVMYDIESDKIRRYIVKYLQRKGCLRVQRSIFFADLDASSCEEIKRDLAEVQAIYENKDSILIVPISTDMLKSMKVIGQNLNIDIITNTENTLFF